MLFSVYVFENVMGLHVDDTVVPYWRAECGFTPSQFPVSEIM
jgi:hypothetical protein